jgi:hypothetical protein
MAKQSRVPETEKLSVLKRSQQCPKMLLGNGAEPLFLLWE